jgi:hypothetical protein
MLHEFLTTNRDELVRRCRQKEARRGEPVARFEANVRGVPLFLQQLVDTLQLEQLGLARKHSRPGPMPTPTSSAIGRAAAEHGAQLLRSGHTIDQVVHDYGDVCQSVTEMALEKKLSIGADEFRTLNRCLDDAIADAVTAYARDGMEAAGREADAAQDRLESISEEQRRLIDTAIHAFAAVRTGSIGLSGATGTVLMHTLLELRTLAQSVAKNAQPGPG